MRITVSEKVFKEKNLEVGEIYANKQYTKEMYKKLSDLEDIEEELGIELSVLFKALKDGIWSKHSEKIEKIVPNENCHLTLDCNSSSGKINYWILSYCDTITNETIDDWWITDYGKTWALTKEELENGKEKD